MADLPEVGLRAVLEGAGRFEEDARRVADAYKRIAEAEAAIARTSPTAADALARMRQEFADAGGDLEQWAETLEEFTQQTLPQAAGGFERMAALMSLGALQQVAGTMDRIGESVLGMAKESALAAARVEELYAVLDNLARQSGIGAGYLREQVEAVKELGITTDVAVSLVSQFVRYNLDLSKASELARLAQDAAVISMEDSSQALAGLLNGVLTLNPVVLRHHGVVADLEGAYEAWAEANGRVAADLTASEKQAIALNAVLAQGQAVTGTYEAAMGTASKQLRSFARYSQELKEDFGNALLPVLSQGVFTAKDLVKAVMGLPEPLKAALAASGALAGAMLKGGATAITTAAQVAQLAVALKTLASAEQLAALGFLGPAGLVAGLVAVVGVGIVSAIKSHEEALIREHTAILNSSEAYQVYIKQMDEAGRSSYALTEGLYNLVKAQEASAQAAFAEGLVRARNELEKLAANLDPVALEFHTLNELGEQAITPLTDMQLAVLRDREAVLLLGTEIGKSGEELLRWTDQVVASATATDLARQANENYNRFERERYQTLTQLLPTQEDYLQLTDRFVDAMLRAVPGTEQFRVALLDLGRTIGDLQSQINTAGVPAIVSLFSAMDRVTGKASELIEVAAGMAQVNEKMLGAIDSAASSMARAEESADAQRLSARQSLMSSLESLERDHARNVTKILEQIAKVDEDLQADILAAERDNANARLKAEQDLQQSLEQLARDTARRRAEIEQKLQQTLADLETKFGQKQEDLERDLARDREDMERDHLSRMEKLEQEYYADLGKLAEDYNQKLLSITQKYDQERQSILAKYSMAPEEPGFDERREKLMEELKRLESMPFPGVYELSRIQELRKELEKLKQEELAALEARKQEELNALKEWYAKEQEAAEEAYQEALAAEEAAYEEQRNQRLQEYERRLEDLQIQLQREREEAIKHAEQELENLKAQDEAKRAELQAYYEQKLADLDAELEAEKARLAEAAEAEKERLRQQLATEQQNYADRRAELAAHYDAQIAQIEEKLSQEKARIKDGLDAEKLEIINKLSEQSDAFAAAYKKQRDELESHLFGPGGMLEKWKYYQQLLATMYGVKSPSKWFQEFGEAQVRGLQIGTADFGKALGSIVDRFAGLQAELGGSRVPGPSLVPVSQVSNVINQRTFNLNYTGRPYPEPSLRAMLTMMEMASG